MSVHGVRSRLSLGLRTLSGTLLAFACALLAVHLTNESYLRVDLSQSGRNSLDEEIVDLIGALPEPVVADVFVRRLPPPYDAISGEVSRQLDNVLRVAMESRRDRFELRWHDAADFEATQRRQRELGVEGIDFVLFTNESGTRRARADLYGEIAVVDWGVPDLAGYQALSQAGITEFSRVADRPENARPAQVSSFRGEEVLTASLLKVSSARSPRVYFSTGQGEPSLEDHEGAGLSDLARLLEEDGFEVATWNPAEEPEVPADCEALALIGPTQPFPVGTLERVREWVAGGGRVIAAPALQQVEAAATGGVVELLTGYGMVPLPGVVCEPIRGVGAAPVTGDPSCARLNVSDEGLSGSNPLTEPLRRRNRRLDFDHTNAFRRGGFAGGILLDIVTSSPDAWRDLALVPGQYDYRRDRGESPGRQILVMYLELAGGRVRDDGELEKGRVLGLGNSRFCFNGLLGTNKDFLLNAFNWMDQDRNYRIRVTPLARPESRLDLRRSNALAVLTWSLYLGLPGLCVVIGCALAWRRRS